MAIKCKVEGCDRLAQHQKGGMCCTHHTASRPAVVKAPPVVSVAKVPKARCSVAGCTKQVQILGMCKRHRSLALLDAGINPVDTIIAHVEKAAAVQVKEVVEEVDSCDACGVHPCCCFDDNNDGTANYEHLQEVIAEEKAAYDVEAYANRIKQNLNYCPVCQCNPCQCSPDLHKIKGMAAEIDALVAFKLAEWFDDLAGATTERSRSRLFVSMCDALEGLGY